MTVGTETPAWRGWAGWGLAALLFAYGYAARVPPGVMVGELMRDFAVGAAVLGNLTAIYFYVYAAMKEEKRRKERDGQKRREQQIANYGLAA
jgi:hypothetical protein